MFRLIGIVVICLSTLIGPAVHASSIASGLPAIATQSNSDPFLTGGQDQIAGAAPIQQNCVTASHEKTEAQRCHVGIAPPPGRFGFAIAQTGRLALRTHDIVLRGIGIAPPHGPPRHVFPVHLI